ncbi:MAG: polymer-forming cytoskeletal protein [Acidobacteriota bacterium]|nr:polymer-forming cytoskeletal protein [Blastocatellia bacterium]MDW8412083.1 polymer-forming cytoskeletal protein [Acidobacteriota bacterium]
MPEELKQTILEDGTEVEGSIRSRGPITVSGKVKGEVSAPALLVTQTGAVHGQVKVSQLKSQGEIAGEIDADSVELSGKVNDQTVIKANTLEVMLSRSDGKLQVSFGNCELHVGDKAATTPKPEQKIQQQAQPKESKVK